MEKIFIFMGHDVKSWYDGMMNYLVIDDGFMCWSMDQLIAHLSK